jgi:tetratricopeptide (TPR) repeat protein
VSVVIFSIYSSISSFASLEAGKAEKVWEAYFQSSDSGVALEAFEKLAARKDAAPAEWLGLASVLDGRERLSEAQSAYTGMLESVWREMLKYSPEKAASLRDLENELVLSDLEQGTPEAIDQAIWLWAMGQVALYSANKIAPYGKDREGYLNLLGAMADAPAPGWTGFQQLQSEARFTLASRLLESGQWERVERLTTDNGFLRDFLWIGPFPNKEEAGYDEVFAPELEFDLSAEYEGLLRSVRWRPLHPAPRWGYVNFQALVEPVENSTVYALTFVYSNRVRPVAVDLGHAGAAKVWVAGRWVIGNDSYHEATPFQVHASAELQGGWNPILVKLCSKESSQFGFYLRLTTPEGRPLVAEKTPPERLRFWSSSDEIPDASGWPVMGGDGEDLHDWNLDTLARLTDPERSPLESTLADWLASAYLDFHSSLDEISTQALDLLRLAEERYPRCGLIQRWIGIVELDENLSRQAYEKAAELDPAEVLALSQLARHYLDKPYKDRALETVEKGLARNPNSPRLWLFKGEALMRQPESAPLARLAFLKGSQLSPGYYYGLYRSIQTEGDALTLDQSIEKLSAALDLDRTVADVRFQLVRALLRAGRAEEAWKTAEEATRADPYDSRGYEILARHFRAASDWEQANAAIEKALDISPEAPGLNALAGEIYHEQGRSEDARAAWQLALTVKPNDPRLEEYLNLLYEDSDDYYRPYRIDLAALPEARSEDYPEASLVVLLDQEVQKVYSNGSSSRTTHLVRKALTDAGVNQMKSHAIYFDPEQERVKIKRARVIRPDGSVFDAPRPTVRSARGGGDSRIYGDYSVQLLSFPAVEKGATVDLEYEVQETGKNIYVDYFGSQFYFGQFDPSLLCEYVLIAPAQRKFYWKMTEPDARYALPEARKVTEFPEDRLSRGNFFLESEGPTSACGRGIIRIAL